MLQRVLVIHTWTKGLPIQAKPGEFMEKTVSVNSSVCSNSGIISVLLLLLVRPCCHHKQMPPVSQFL